GATVGTVDVSNTTHTNAGSEERGAGKFTGTPKYNNIADTSITDTISKADATEVDTPYHASYNRNPHPPTHTITGLNGDTHANAGSYSTDTWSFTGAANYNNIAATTITDAISKADATVVVTPYSVSYNGNAHTATYTITGVNGETGATVGTVDVSNTTHTNAGSYNADSWSFTGAANYNNIAATTITDTISKADATVVVTPYSVSYNGQPHTARSKERRVEKDSR